MITFTKNFTITLFPLCLLGSTAFGQNAIQLADSRGYLSQSNGDSKLAPYLVEEESSDVGPQYLLDDVPTQPSQPWFYFTSDLLVTYTSNPTLVEAGEEDSSLSIWTNHLKFMPPVSFDLFGGQLEPTLGIQHQFFRYGMFGDENEVISGSPVDSNDFDVLTLYGEDVWTRGDWTVRTGLQYQTLSASSGGEFYNEITPYVVVGKRFSLNQNQLFYLEYTGWYRFTETDSSGAFPDDINDRTDHRLTLLYRQSILNPNFIIEPWLSLRYSHFTESRDRSDWYTTAGLSGTYYFNEYFSARVEMTYEQLDTDEALANDYTVFDLGLGGALEFRF